MSIALQINSVKRNEVILEPSNIIKPQDNIIIEYLFDLTGDNIGDKLQYFFRLKFNNNDANIYDFYIQDDSDNNNNNNNNGNILNNDVNNGSNDNEILSLLITIPLAYSFDNLIEIIPCRNNVTDNGSNTIIQDEENKLTYQYDAPLIIDNNIKINRKDENDPKSLSPVGQIVMVDKLFELLSGDRQRITSFTIEVIRSKEGNDNSCSETFNTQLEIEKYFPETGYYKDFLDSENPDIEWLFKNDLSTYKLQQKFFNDIKYSYEIKFIIHYKSLDNLENNLVTLSTYLNQVHASLQLVGRTITNNNSIVYGGVAIGQDPTINVIGEPAFECGYPAYFNGIKYGYYPGDTYEVYPQQTIPGYVGSNKIDLIVTFYLGQPIFATDFDITGNFVGLAYRELSNAKFSAPCQINTDILTIDKKIVNSKSGVIVIVFTKKSGNWGSEQYNRTAIITPGTENIKLTFK